MRFGLLGPVEVWSAGQVLFVERPLRRATLAYLLLHANKVVSLDQLADALWGGAEPPSARAQIHAAVSRIRRVLREADLGEPLSTRPGGYLFSVQDGELDLGVFAEHTARARTAAATGQADVAEAAFLAALQLWRGPALGGTTAAYVDTARAKLDEQRLVANEDLIDVQLGLGRHADLVAELGPLVDAHPLRERLTAQLMLALYRTGRQAEALAAFHRLRRQLSEQLGIDPRREIGALHEAILRGEPPSGPAGDRPAGDRSAGVSSTGGRPSSSGPPSVPAQLPADLADFTGRADDLATLDALLPADVETIPGRTVVISAIAGTAGVGKTALAVHWAHRVAPRFPDGQLYLNLRGYAPAPPVRPIEALAQFLRAMGVSPDRVPVDVDEAAGLYRSTLAGRRVLVVLDNARSADQVRPLLPGSPTSLVLITSRDRLDGLVAREGARRLAIDTLTTEDAITLLAQIVGMDRIAAEPAAAGELARACALLPLALRIAAANLAADPHKSISGYLAELSGDDRLALLRVADDEQTAVRATFDLSYETLTAPAQRLFRLLGLIPGQDFSADAVTALAAVPTPTVRQLVDRLAAANLVQPCGQDRFTFHDLLRRYAKDHAEADDERRAALDRLLTWYLHTADAAVRPLYPHRLRLELPPDDTVAPLSFADKVAAKAWLDAERPNLVAAVQLAAEHGPPRVAALLAHTLRGYFSRRGHTVDWLIAAKAAAAAVENTGWPLDQAAAQLNLAMVYWHVGRHQQAVEHLSAAVMLAQRAGWRDGEIAARTNLGNVSAELGRLQEAARHHGAVLALAREIGTRLGVAAALNNLGQIYHAMGQLGDARASVTEALTIREAAEDPTFPVNAHTTLAAVNRDAGSYHKALEHGTAALAGARDLGDQRAVAEVQNVLGTINRRLGRQQQAIEQHADAFRFGHETGDLQPEVDALIGLVALDLDLGDQAKAFERATQAVALAGRTGSQVFQGQALTALADAQLAGGRAYQAIETAQRALDIHRQTGYRLDEARTLVTLGNAYRQARGPELALSAWRQAHALLTEIGSPEAGTVAALLVDAGEAMFSQIGWRHPTD